MAVDEIEFASVETLRHTPRLRPDRDGRWAVVPSGVPEADERPIFVALDVLREVESHAASDVRVELGGVLLGTACEDDQGAPFLVIEDSLRARHCESTAGSLKFTHATWAAFTAQRAGMPEARQIVGWYHSHPNLGVFLSEWDRFICEHFFRGPADVALVIDPCQQDRGFFQWSRGGPPQRTTGFYVFSSRQRFAELKCLVAYLNVRWNAFSFS